LKQLKYKKNDEPISRILSFEFVETLLKSSIIYLRAASPLRCICLPFPTSFLFRETELVRVALLAEAKSEYTWHFNPRGLSARFVAKSHRALLPHIFTLTVAGGYFLRHSLSFSLPQSSTR